MINDMRYEPSLPDGSPICEIGINKKDPQYFLLRVFGCPGGNACSCKPRRCPARFDTYNWYSLVQPPEGLEPTDPDGAAWLVGYWEEAVKINTDLADAYSWDAEMRSFFQGIVSGYRDAARSLKERLNPGEVPCDLCGTSILNTTRSWIEHDCVD